MYVIVFSSLLVVVVVVFFHFSKRWWKLSQLCGMFKFGRPGQLNRIHFFFHLFILLCECLFSKRAIFVVVVVVFGNDRRRRKKIIRRSMEFIEGLRVFIIKFIVFKHFEVIFLFVSSFSGNSNVFYFNLTKMHVDSFCFDYVCMSQCVCVRSVVCVCLWKCVYVCAF